MKKKILLIIMAMTFAAPMAWAQDIIDDGDDEELVDEEDDEDDGDDEEEEDEGTADDEIVVVDAQGNEEEIAFPEAMEFDVDSLLDQYNAKNYLTPDTDCQWRNENPMVSDSTLRERLRRLPTVMEMPFNDIVRIFIDRYANRMRTGVGYMLGASNFYMPIFEEALDVYGLPLELKYLPVIESALKPTAVSRVGATGLWQFMLATGKQYGLKVNSLIDERRDPLKASMAAAHYLSDLYKIFGDWNLVIAAYNCGPENVNKAIHRANGTKDYWQIYPYLPRETRGYVPAFIAANYIMNYYCEHNICPMATSLPAKSDTVVVTRDVHFDQIAALCDISKEQLRALNPEYRRDIVPGLSQPSAIRMPIASITKFIDQEDSIYDYRASELLTKRSEVVVAEDNASYQRPTTRRYVSKKSARTKKGAKRAKTKRGKKSRGSKAANRNVTVRKGQTLSSIAKANGTTVAKLKKLNGIKGNNIRAGKKLKVK